MLEVPVETGRTTLRCMQTHTPVCVCVDRYAVRADPSQPGSLAMAERGLPKHFLTTDVSAIALESYGLLPRWCLGDENDGG